MKIRTVREYQSLCKKQFGPGYWRSQYHAALLLHTHNLTTDNPQLKHLFAKSREYIIAAYGDSWFDNFPVSN